MIIARHSVEAWVAAKAAMTTHSNLGPDDTTTIPPWYSRIALNMMNDHGAEAARLIKQPDVTS